MMDDDQARLSSMHNLHQRRREQIAELNERITWLHPVGSIRTYRNGVDATAAAIAEDLQTIKALESANRQLSHMIVKASGIAPTA
jgi:hypothetical protein